MNVNEVIKAAFEDFAEVPVAGDFGCQYGATRTVLRSGLRECVAWHIVPRFGAAFVFKNGKSGYNAYHFCRTDFVREQRGSFIEMNPVAAMRWIEKRGGTLSVQADDVEKHLYGDAIGSIERCEDSPTSWGGDKYKIYRTKKGTYLGVGVEDEEDEYHLGSTRKILPSDIVQFVDEQKWKCDVPQAEMEKVRALALGQKL